MKHRIHKAGVYDIINETDWPADFLKMVTPLIDESIAKREGRQGRYYFYETDQCIYYERH